MGSTKSKALRNIQKGKEEYAVRLFDQYDKDKKGYIIREEALLFFGELFDHLGIEGDRDNVTQQWLAYYDQDKIGRLTKSEFVNSLDIAKGTVEMKKIATKKQVPYGSWESPFTEDMLYEARNITELSTEGEKLYWLEQQPNGYKSVVQGTFNIKTNTLDCIVMTSNTINVGNRVNEHGGGSYWVQNGVLYYSSTEDGSIYNLQKRVTPLGNSRYADFVVNKTNDKLYAVCEFPPHSDEEFSSQALVQIEVADGEQKVLAFGNDFYSSPRLSYDGTKLAYLTWNSPNMPWDGCELWVALLDGKGNSHIKIAGGNSEYISQPNWSSDGYLYFVSDKDNVWGNMWRHDLDEGKSENIFPHPGEFGVPLWTFRNSSYTLLNENEILCCYFEVNQGQLLGLIDMSSSKPKLTPFLVKLDHFSDICTLKDSIFLIGGGPLQPNSIFLFQKDAGLAVVLRSGFSDKITLDFIYFCSFDKVSWQVENRTIFGILYSPLHPMCDSEIEEPPLIVMAHDGPTYFSHNTLNLTTLFWTSRGFAVLTVDYSGSWGYGKDFVKSVYRKWGIVDAEDCCIGAMILASSGRADRHRLVIYGLRAGGYTALSCAAFYNVFSSVITISGISNLQLHMKKAQKFEVGYIGSLIALYHKRNKPIFRNCSPFYHYNNIQAPVFLFHDEKDSILSEQSELLAKKKKKKKKKK